MGSLDIQVTRWRRYGNDRLYVERADGQKVGWWDLVAQEAHAETAGDMDVLVAAVSQWQNPQDGEALPVVVEGEPAPAMALESAPAARPVGALDDSRSAPLLADESDSSPRPWIDLTTNQAGAEAREQALAAREAAPVRTFLARALGVHTDERAWRIGADGEEKVAAQLVKTAKKDPRWRSLHAIPVGDRGSDIDHLIIGPGGVFTANTKNHPNAKIWVGGNTFMVNGHKQPYVRNSRYEAARAERLLTNACGFPVHIGALIVPVNAIEVTIKSQPADVHVVPRRQLAKWLLRHGDIHDDAALDAIHEAARRSTTWRP